MTFSMSSRHPQRRLAIEPLEHRFLLTVTFAEHAILDRGGLGGAIHSADMDNDGDLDVVFVSSSTIYWYENSDGRGNFKERQAIGTTWGESRKSIYPADMDRDGDTDVLALVFGPRIVWYENTDGKGSFGEAPHVVTSRPGNNTWSIYAADLDGDGDVDALLATANDGKVAWYENVDGRGTAWEQHVIATGLKGARVVYAADVDGDGDPDVGAASNWGTFTWYENIDGNGRFGSQQIVFEGRGATGLSLYAADLDSDGDTDVLSVTHSGPSAIAWYENLDGRGQFGPQQVITQLYDRNLGVHAGDLDNDGDLDVITSNRIHQGGTVHWLENTDGKGSFGPLQPISTRSVGFVYSVHTSDIDADGDMDVVVNANGHIAWYENLLFDPAPLAAPGDVNGDFQFSQTDIVQVLQAAKYLTGQPAIWQEGDWNDDGVFDQLDIVAALQTGNYLQGPYAAESRTGWLAPEGAENRTVDKLLGLKLELDDLLAPF